MRENGIFITLEGIDGSGKSTNIQLIKELFEKEGFTVVTTREPGGTPMADKIRGILLSDWGSEDIDPLTEVLLFSASRKQHLENLIKPNLAKGYVVISDRYVDSMLAYQGATSGNMAMAEKLSDMVCGTEGRPDYTIYFSVDPEVAMERMSKRIDENRFDTEVKDFKIKAINCYEDLLKKHRDRYIKIDANGDLDKVRKQLTICINNIVKVELSLKKKLLLNV